ncbi:MAG TPA: hypothetical protein VFT32_09170 [Candidatus Eisenbacteria bacterium]|nr:hypothetical protein [Candidatus Eisenbacteria bacterium]
MNRAVGIGSRAGLLTVLAIEAIALLGLASLRFDYRDPGVIGRFTSGVRALPGGHGLDVEGYVRLTEYFRGTAPADSMMPPYCYRPLAPLAASLLPVRALTALNLVNLIALLGAFIAVVRTLLRMGLGAGAVAAGGAIFAVSFPTFYYATIGFVDPVAVFAVALLVEAMAADRPLWWIAVVAALGSLVKETNAAFSILPFVRAYAGGVRATAPLTRRAALPLLCVGLVILVRVTAPFPGRDSFWAPSAAAIVENLTRPRTYLSLGLTVGLPFVLAALGLASREARARLGAPDRAMLVAGSLVALGLYLYSVCSAYTDGRIIWAIYPFTAPLAAAWIDARLGRPGGR